MRPRNFRDWLAAALVVALIVGGAASVWWLSRYTLAVRRLTRGVGDTMFYSADGRPWFRLDEQRHDVPLAQISPDLQHAVVAIEDRRFFYHPGIDPIGVARAIVHDVRAGGRVEGGSTLTQQLARTLFLSNVRTFGRKAKEAGIALLIEQQLTKNQILELYLNRVYLSAGVYGVETMAEHLFRKPARALTLPEAALIAALIRAPSTLSPWSNYDGALERSRTVLRRDAGAGVHHGAAGGGRASRAAAHSAVPAAGRNPRRRGRRTFCASSFATSSAATIRRTGRCTRPSCRRRRRRPNGRSPAVWPASTVRGCRPRWWRSIRRPAISSRWSAAATTGRAPSTGRSAAAANRDPRSSRSVYAAALARGYSPVSVLSSLDKVSVPGDREWSPRNAEGDLPGRADASRGAASNRTTPPPPICSRRSGSARC